MAHILTVIVDIVPDQKETLDTILTGIGQNPAHNDHLSFATVPGTHFARFVLLGGGTIQDRDAQTRLLFTVVHDGSADAYIEALLRYAGHGVREIWGRCVGYPSGNHGRSEIAALKAYFKKHECPPSAAFAAYPQTAAEIEAARGVRIHLQNLLNRPELDPFLAALSHLPFRPLPDDAWRKAILRWILRRVLRLCERLFGPPISSDPTTRSSAPVDTRPERTAWLESVQNEMTVLVGIKPERLAGLRRFLGIVDFAASHNPLPGELSGITTIHFAFWAIIDDGKNLLFESNYDGNWEQYIGDFVDKASGGMDAIWGNCMGFPERGAKDLQAFKQIIIEHQVRAHVFYAVRPHESARNVLNDIAIGQHLTRILSGSDIARLMGRL